MGTRARAQEVTAIDPFLRWLIATAMSLVLWAAITAPASAQGSGGPPALDYASCGHFETREDAQQVLDAGTLDANGIASLDADGDGIACEDVFGTGSPDADDPPEPVTVRVLPSTGSGARVTSDSTIVFLAGYALISLAAALLVRQHSRR